MSSVSALLPMAIGVLVDAPQRLAELRQIVRPAQRDAQPDVLRRAELFADVVQDRLKPDHVGIERLGGRDEPREAVGLLHPLHRGRRRRADGDVVEDLAPQPRRDLDRPLDDAANLQIEPRSAAVSRRSRARARLR